MRLSPAVLRLAIVLVLGLTLTCVVWGQPRRPLEGQRPAAAQMTRLFNRFPILKKMLDAHASLRYSGLRVVEMRIGPDRQRNTEIVLRDGLLQRTEFTSDSPNAGQIIIENGRMRRHYFPDTNEVQVLPARGDEAMARYRGLLMQVVEGQIKVEVEPGGEIAGRSTQLVEFTDSRGNPLQKLWVDSDSGMLVKRELYDAVGTRIGFFEFQRINFRPTIAADDFEIKRRGAALVTLDDQIRRMSRNLGFQPVRIPDGSGFELDGVRAIDVGGSRALMQTYSGEKGRFSLYQLNGNVDHQRLRRLAGGSNLSVFTWQTGGRTLALIGELTPRELERLAGAIRSL